MTTPSATPAKPRRGAWAQAARLAAQTPASRNRYVDFLRAISITAVVTGHWLVVAPYVQNGELIPAEILSIVPWTQWFTWVFQVMPVFFIVGGFANSISWQSAQQKGLAYGPWLSARLRRLIGPVLPLLAAWAVIGLLAQAANADPALLKVISQFALLPAWFLVVYIVVVTLVPAAYRVWVRYGYGSFWALAACAVLVDVLALGVGWRAVGWVNYLFIWLAVHQLGFAWREGRLSGARKSLPWAVGGLLLLIGLVVFGPYPPSMVSVAGEEISNTLPPNLTMLALGLFQGGLLLALEAPVRRWLDKMTPWTATVLVNGMIMTVFMWHVTAMMLVAGLALFLGGVGLTPVPGSVSWWITRPLWLGALGAALLLLVTIFVRFERSRPPANTAPPPVWRLLVGAGLVCAGLAILTLKGVTGDGWLGLRLGELSMPFIGAALAGFGPLRQKRRT